MKKLPLSWMFNVLVVCLLLADFSHAERVARVLYYGAPADAPKTAFVHQGEGEAQEVILERNNFSDSFELGAGALRLTFLPTALLEDVPNPKAAPFLSIPEGWNKVLILLSEDKSNEVLPIQLKAINANDDQFGPGELLFINFSKLSVFGVVGEKKLTLKPQGRALISNPAKVRGDYNVQLDSMRGGKEETRRWLVRQAWRHQPSVRRVIFVFPRPAPRNLKLYSAPIRNF